MKIKRMISAGSVKFGQVSTGFNEFDTKQYPVSLGSRRVPSAFDIKHDGFCRVSQGFFKFRRVSQGLSGFRRVSILGTTGFVGFRSDSQVSSGSAWFRH